MTPTTPSIPIGEYPNSGDGRPVSLFLLAPTDERTGSATTVEHVDVRAGTLPLGAALLRAGDSVQGSLVVLMAGGAACGPDDWRPAVRLLCADDHIGAVVPQVLWSDGSLAEAGALRLADGTLVSSGDGESPRRSEHTFRRPVAGSRFACVVLRRCLIARLSIDPSLDIPEAVVSAVLGEIRRTGHVIMFEPTWTVTLSAGRPDTISIDGPAAATGPQDQPHSSIPSIARHQWAALRDSGQTQRILVVCVDLGGPPSPWSDAGVADLIHALERDHEGRLTVACAEAPFDDRPAAYLRARGIEVETGPSDWACWFGDRAYHFSHVIVTDGALFSGLARHAIESQPQAAKVLWTTVLPFRAIEAMLPVTPHREKAGHEYVRATVASRTAELVARFDRVWSGSLCDRQHLSGLLTTPVQLLNRPITSPLSHAGSHGERWGMVVLASPGADVVAGHEDAAVTAAEEIFARLYQRDPHLRLTVVTDRPTPRVVCLADQPGVRIVSPGTDEYSEPLSQARVVLAPYRHGLGGSVALRAALSARTPVLTTSLGARGFLLGELAEQAVFDGPLDLVERAWMLHQDEGLWNRYRSVMDRVVGEQHSSARFHAEVRAGLLELGIVPADAPAQESTAPSPATLPSTGTRRPAAPWRTNQPPLRPADLPARVRASVPDGVGETDGYRLWCRTRGPTPEVIEALRADATALEYRPTISIVMPVYNTEPDVLEAALASVRTQLYDNWELCVADDCSTREDTKAVLTSVAEDPRIRVSFLSEPSGISGASNAAIALASGEYITLLDHDDLLKPHALAQVARWLNVDPDLDVLYSDEDKLNEAGELVTPFFKPDWSPNLLMATNYVCHLLVARRSLVEKVGGFRSGFDGSQDHDLVLRLTEQTDRIAHIPEPLYTWRMVPGSAAAQADAKPYAFEAAKRALREALVRRGQEGTVDDGDITGVYRARYRIPGSPRVSIIIPTRDKVEYLRRCVESIREKTTYGNYEIVVIDNESRESATLEYLASLGGHVIRYPAMFNYARMLNLAAHTVECEALLFLNNDTEVINGEWIEALLEHGMRPEVGAVGCRLYLPDGRTQHEGIFVGAMGTATNVDHAGFWGLGEMTRDCSAITGACTMVRPAVYWGVGGNDERLRIAYNDVDICLRIRQAGYQVVYTPYARLLHFEGASRAGYEHVDDAVWFSTRWRQFEELDPYYNPNFDRGRLFRLAL